jgi:XTP/dITP diphosphohydrolase
MSERRIVCASANPDKVAEIESILAAVGVVLEPRPSSVPDVVEDADTLEGNARLKAAAIAEATGLAALADDTGLEIDALDGAPGVHSARYAGDDATYADNVAKVMQELRRVGADTVADRRARFRTVVLVRGSDGAETVAEGVVEGHIALEARGDAGFGYDPVFIADDTDGRTFAELSPDEKHAISHRGRALRALASSLS